MKMNYEIKHRCYRCWSCCFCSCSCFYYRFYGGFNSGGIRSSSSSSSSICVNFIFIHIFRFSFSFFISIFWKIKSTFGFCFGIEVVKNSEGACVFCTVLIRGRSPPYNYNTKYTKPPPIFWHSLNSFQLVRNVTKLPPELGAKHFYPQGLLPRVA